MFKSIVAALVFIVLIPYHLIVFFIDMQAVETECPMCHEKAQMRLMSTNPLIYCCSQCGETIFL